ncbi:unnamed protein product [Rotaria sordida]|uniref:Thiopurine S-methyltransferase n=2 Tax=Rotaria sordida TaxID=392033 RepID=A0A819HXT2_9BILA|nr:unnamed protein product [Rotaria sordida]CAF1292231.1 unnamed protein product [Rotaria sordida]CAF3905366.1 unnamed protein product [Rotaria sordida]
MFKNKKYNNFVIGVECSTLAAQELFDEYIGTGNYTIENRSTTCSIYSAYDNRLVVIVCDIFADELTPSLIGGHVSFVWDRAALTALHPANHLRYIEKLRQLSEVHSQYLISVYWHPEPPDQGPPFSISTECISKLFPHDQVLQLDDIDAKNERWADTAFEQLRECCYCIET